jgi:hypothetical protein
MPQSSSDQPRLISKQLTSDDVQAQSDEIAAAVHEFVTVYRDPARILVMHPADFERLWPHFQNERGDPEGEDRLEYRVYPELDRGAILLADADNPDWSEPGAQPSGR